MFTMDMELRFSNSNGGQVEKITNGKMRCEISSSTTNLDKNFEYVFHFSDNQLNRVEYTAITKGDPSLDEATLNEMNDVCKRLSADTEAIVGVTVRCNYTEGKLTETQSYDLKNLDMTEVRSTFAEAGGTNPEYPYGQDMDVIERSMIASGFECKRES